MRHHVQRFGKGERTVVFIHGLVMDNLSSFYFTLANPIAETCDVICYDLRGHGMSERPPTGYSVDTLVADLAALLDALEITRPVDIVGNSFGGLLALAFAAKHPDRVARLALIDAHTGVDGWAAQMTATLAVAAEPALDRRVVPELARPPQRAQAQPAREERRGARRADIARRRSSDLAGARSPHRPRDDVRDLRRNI